MTMNELDPFQKFIVWHAQAEKSEVKANAMTLSTVAANGQPSSRTVALAEFNSEIGFVFYTDFNSQKAREIAENPRVALLFYWPNLYQQVRIEGVASKTSHELSDKYFYQRAKEKQLSASISQQSAKVENLDALYARYQAEAVGLSERFIERPRTWGGYQVKPERFEFWVGSEVRMHTRTVFERDGDEWVTYYLQP